jgi:uncharacterized protein YfkK (UPF0435 family)
MENWLLYVFLGLALGVVISLFWSEIDRSQAVELNNSRKSYYEKQCQDILDELGTKQIDPSSAKEPAITLLYQFAASKNYFSLKDIERCTQQLQELYKKNLEFEGVFKRNFPEKEDLNFEPKQVLQLLIIINEGMHNAAIHSHANFIFTILSIESEKMNLITHDNGSGYDRKLIPEGEGIQRIKKAAQKLGGDLKLTSTIGNGTVVNVGIPILQRDSRQSKTDFINQSIPQSPR